MKSFVYPSIVSLLCIVLLYSHSLAGSDLKVNADTDTTTQNEPSITVNRYFSGDPLNIVVGYNDIGKSLGISYSPDSGNTWNDVQLPTVWTTTGDPSLACDASGNVYACFLSYEGNWFTGKSGIFVCKSTDGGRTWLTPSAVDSLEYTGGAQVPFADKCFITVDTNATSPYLGYVYVAWQRDDTLGSHSDLYFARSTDGGITFSTPIKINDGAIRTAWAEGATPVVGADGDVYVVWVDAYFRGYTNGAMYVDKSTDGGVTFGTDVKVADLQTPHKYPNYCTSFKVKSFPSVATHPMDPEKLYITYTADPDGHLDNRVDGGTNDGQANASSPDMAQKDDMVYMVWADGRYGTNSIFFNYSNDTGKTWQPEDIGPLNNGGTPGTDHADFPKIAVVGNYIYVAWVDARNGIGDVYFNQSSDYGATWSTDQRLDASGSTLTMPANISIAAEGTDVCVAWQEDQSSPGVNDIFFNRSSNNGGSWSGQQRLDVGDIAGATNSAEPVLMRTGNFVYCVWLDGRVGQPQVYFNYSINNGANWLPAALQISHGPTSAYCDNVRMSIENTNVFVTWTDDRSAWTLYDIYFNRSLTNGSTWNAIDTKLNSAPSATGYPTFGGPKPSIDAESGYVYVGWNDTRDATYSDHDIYFNYSSDSGITWQISDIGPLDGSAGGINHDDYDVTIAADGNNVYAMWWGARLAKDRATGSVYFNHSSDFGATWQATERRITHGPLGVDDFQDGWAMTCQHGWVNIGWTEEQCCCMGIRDLYATYSTDAGATWPGGPDEADVFCVRSLDGGSSWNTPVRVNDDFTDNEQVLPFVAVMDDGRVHIVWYDRRVSPNNDIAKVYTAISSDNGATFSTNLPLQESIIPPMVPWVGEYIGVAVLDTVAYTVFTDFAGGSSDIWFDRTFYPTMTTCCVGNTGNVNGDVMDNVDISDLTKLVNHLFVTFESLPCPAEANTSGDAGCAVDISDLTKLVNHLFVTFEALAPCDPGC